LTEIQIINIIFLGRPGEGKENEAFTLINVDRWLPFSPSPAYICKSILNDQHQISIPLPCAGRTNFKEMDSLPLFRYQNAEF
jgi:hypothetical protein